MCDARESVLDSMRPIFNFFSIYTTPYMWVCDLCKWILSHVLSFGMREIISTAREMFFWAVASISFELPHLYVESYSLHFFLPLPSISISQCEMSKVYFFCMLKVAEMLRLTLQWSWNMVPDWTEKSVCHSCYIFLLSFSYCKFLCGFVVVGIVVDIVNQAIWIKFHVYTRYRLLNIIVKISAPTEDEVKWKIAHSRFIFFHLNMRTFIVHLFYFYHLQNPAKQIGKSNYTQFWVYENDSIVFSSILVVLARHSLEPIVIQLVANEEKKNNRKMNGHEEKQYILRFYLKRKIIRTFYRFRIWKEHEKLIIYTHLLVIWMSVAYVCVR